jgi:hypothetical protein
MNAKSQITKIERDMLRLTPRVRSIIVGLILSDAWLQKRGHWNPRIGFKQSVVNSPYFYHVYFELAYLCAGPIFFGKSVLRGKIFYNISFQTRQLPCFMEIFNLFYKTVDKKWVKTIKQDLFFYMDYIVLAHWIMGDGSKLNKGITLCTNSFTLQEVVLLINILTIKFDIQPTIHKDNSNHRIYITGKDLNKVKPHILLCRLFFIQNFLVDVKHWT